MLTLPTLAVLLTATLGQPVQTSKKLLDHSVYDGWKAIQAPALSRDGQWILYRIAPQEGDAVLEVKRTDGSTTHRIERGGTAQFTQDSRFVVASVVPPLAETKKARRDKVKPEDQPKNALTILDLKDGKQTSFLRVTTFQLAEKDSGWLVYKPEPSKPEPPKPEPKPAEPKPAEAKKDDKKPTKKTDHKPGEPIVLRNLQSGAELRIEDVTAYRFSRDGKVLAYAISTKDGAGDGIFWHELSTGVRTPVLTGLGRYTKPTFQRDGRMLAFLTDRDDYAAKKPGNAVYVFAPKGKAELIAKEGLNAPNGHWIPDAANVQFSKAGTRLTFGTAPKPLEEKKDETPDDEKVNIDIWNWQDSTLQPQQLLRASTERNRTYDTIYDFASKKAIPLESPEILNSSVSQNGDGEYALLSTNKPYQIFASWDRTYLDAYLLNLKTGQRKQILQRSPFGMSFSPNGKYLQGYDEDSREFKIVDVSTGSARTLNKDIPYAIWDELNDVPSPASSLGSAGWTEGDARVLLYDRYDIWSVDPTGKEKPVNVTDGYGRDWKIRLRALQLDPEQEFWKKDQPLVLAAFNERTKDSGFYRDRVSGRVYPQKVVMAPKRFAAPVKAEGAETVMFTRSNFVEYPDVWVADSVGMENPRKLSDANPQQKDYNWGTTELVEWLSNDGEPLQGIVVKPENFDPTKKYPMITYFYERDSDNLHNHRVPAPSASTVNWPYFASNGYVLFVPDIPYKDGYPGESAISAILPGVQHVISKGYVDPKRVGLQGQSWGGYQVTYMVTETNLFACGFAGAPVSNMFSAYGGIRWGSGLVRQFQYEREQSRIGDSMWAKPLRFLENSPIFFADKVKTPLLIMSNDKDGAVPWYQGIEMFTALRRLGKPSWLLVYNEEDHNLVQRKNRKDLSIRMGQFFDHYLKGAPMPVWMKTGIPATEKGKTLGLEVPKG